ncbi:cysteine-rich DPF motif domain-containing protein 1 isoform X1 [Rattus rattus]|uniref:cysteine-rich DPF motif domain-containing protein 1 isoform X1 n=1 Tax=Rattus rattus TaxID=10117 RepID=UPI0013F2CF72|nr:cysteine-rich DPF motif domain-containing protein 1 isoform X1 [Rattus rattus]
MPALCLNSSLQLCRAEAPRHPGCCPPGGELHHEGSLLLRQGQVSDSRFSVQCVQQAGVCGPGMQPVLLQEGLPPLCSGEYQCFPSGNPAGCGEEKGCQQEALQPSLTGRGTASCEALGWAGPGFQLGAVYLVFSELCGGLTLHRLASNLIMYLKVTSDSCCGCRHRPPWPAKSSDRDQAFYPLSYVLDSLAVSVWIIP